ncbi:butyrophilin subfamily 2 member A1-like isoform X2 [Carassius auratus]|uniref:Butyrophilin subfamily 2 member A1-like isoform X2 n=1 Tax=Carassius auratus TaxID=7957 RepID=A0A6P6P0Z2_CARAU|nr:butyrophilin subfamily 2 member A1-like isoform X2 [Carassius auratus]
MLSIIVVLLVNLLIETSVSLTVVVPDDPIEAHVGSTVILPCWISPPENAGALEIRWYRQDQFNNPVLLYNHGKIQDIQEESYRNRSSLTLRSDQSGGLKDGDVSLQLEKLGVQDDGSFQCYVSGENSYDSEEVTLKISASGSTPVLSPKSLDDGRVNISCRSSGWYPEPSVSWTSDEGRVLRPGGTSHTRGADEMISTHSWTTVSLSDAQLVSCSVSLRTGELKEGKLNIQGIVSSGPWKALFLTFLIYALLSSVGFILYKYREKLRGKKTVNKTNSEEPKKDQDCEGGTLENKKKEANSEEPKKEPDCEEGTLEKWRKEVVEDINIEELRKHAVEITIDRKHSHPRLIVSEDSKMVKDPPGYKHTLEVFPYPLHAFGAQRFSSGRHYWEVELKQANSPPKNFWIIGVEERNLTKRKRFLCSDGPRGFYTNTDPPVKLSLTPRPERLGVLLDYDHGQLSFYNVTERKHLLTISSRFSGSVVPLFNPGVGDQSLLTILDLPKPVEPAEPSPLLSNMVAVETAVKASDNPETEEPVESSPLLSNTVAVESAVELDVKSSDNP